MNWNNLNPVIYLLGANKKLFIFYEYFMKMHLKYAGWKFVKNEPKNWIVLMEEKSAFCLRLNFKIIKNMRIRLKRMFRRFCLLDMEAEGEIL